MCLKLYLFPLSMTTIISFQMITSILQFNSIKWLTLHYIISFMLYIRIMSLENMVSIHPGVTCSVSHDIVLLFSYIIGNNFTQLKQFLKSSASIHRSFYYPIAQWTKDIFSTYKINSDNYWSFSLSPKMPTFWWYFMCGFCSFFNNLLFLLVTLRLNCILLLILFSIFLLKLCHM